MTTLKAQNIADEVVKEVVLAASRPPPTAASIVGIKGSLRLAILALEQLQQIFNQVRCEKRIRKTEKDSGDVGGINQRVTDTW